MPFQHSATESVWRESDPLGKAWKARLYPESNALAPCFARVALGQGANRELKLGIKDSNLN